MFEDHKIRCSWKGCTSFYKGSRPAEGWILIVTADRVVVSCLDCERKYRPLLAMFCDDLEFWQAPSVCH